MFIAVLFIIETGNPMNRGAWWATVQGVTKSRIWLSTHTHTHTHTHTWNFSIKSNTWWPFQNVSRLPSSSSRLMSGRAIVPGAPGWGILMQCSHSDVRSWQLTSPTATPQSSSWSMGKGEGRKEYLSSARLSSYQLFWLTLQMVRP